MINHPNRSKKTATEPVLTMTLGYIRSKGPCQDGWLKLIRSVGDDPKTVVSLGDIATSNDAADAAWCFHYLDWTDIAVRRAVISAAILPAVKRASRHTKDACVFEVIGIIEKWCAGDDTADLKKASKIASASAAYAAAASASAAAASASAAYAASTAYAAAADARKTEREQQRQDIIVAFPPLALAVKAA